jgi:hypothetical protein
MSPSELNAAGGASLSLASPCQCLQAIPNYALPVLVLAKKTKHSQFLRAAEAVGLAVPENFKSPSFSKYDVFCTGGFALRQKKTTQCDREPSSDVHQYDFSMHPCPLPHALSVRWPLSFARHVTYPHPSFRTEKSRGCRLG